MSYPSKPQKYPYVAADIVIELPGERIVLVKRKFEPHGLALPGGFVEMGESVPEAAICEAKEETGLDVKLVKLIGVYSKPGRDPRQQTVSIAYHARAEGEPVAGDDAGEVFIVSLKEALPQLCFDHNQVVEDLIKPAADNNQPRA